MEDYDIECENVDENEEKFFTNTLKIETKDKDYVKVDFFKT